MEPERPLRAPERPRILVVDDEATIVEFLSICLEGAGFEVHAATDGRSGLAQFDRLRPDLVILDWMLPGVDGIQVCQILRARGSTPILMLTAKGELDEKVAGLESGADDYLPKPFKFRELHARIRALLRRTHVLVDQTLTVGDLLLNRDTREVTRNGRPLALTPREFDLLELLMSRPRHVITREIIMDRVWGCDFDDTNVIDVHMSALREKLGDRDRSLIQTIRGIGFTLRV